jgi:hypothetical protein
MPQRRRGGSPAANEGEAPVERTARLFRNQARACAQLGSALYGVLLERAADDLLAGGPTRAVVAGHLDDPGVGALPLRVMAGVHALVLTGQAPRLASCYASAGDGLPADPPGPDGAHAWNALADVLAGHRDEIRQWLDSPPQTNDVGRGAALIGGLCHVVHEADLPVRLVEIGASAGLNLRADRFHVAGDVASYGDPAALVVLPHAWQGRPPPDADLRVVERTGGDLSPIDPTSERGRVALAAYVWPDQAERLQRLRGGLRLAAQVPADVRRESASETLRRTRLRDGSWTVVWHSLLRMYLDAGRRAEIDQRLAELAAHATPRARLAHLSLEPRRRTPGATHEFLVMLTTWPPGTTRVLGTAEPHGIPTVWER